MFVKKVEVALERIAANDAIEARATMVPISERIALRRETAPLVASFFGWAVAMTARLSAKSSLAGAFPYTRNRCEALSRFVTEGRLEIDNDIAENAMRCIAMGRKNYLFARSNRLRKKSESCCSAINIDCYHPPCTSRWHDCSFHSSPRSLF